MTRTWGGILKWFNGTEWQEVNSGDFKVYTNEWKVIDSSHFKIYYPEGGDTSAGWYPIRMTTFDLLNGLKAYWKLDDASTGTAINSMSTGDLTVYGGPTQDVSGLIGRGVQYDSSTSALINSSVRPFAGDVSSFGFSLWVYPDVSLSTLGRSWQTIRAGTGPNCFSLQIYNVNNQLAGYIYDVSNNYVYHSSTAHCIREKQWNHIAVSWSINTNASLYVNNVNVTNYVSTTLTKNVAIPNTSFTVGNGYQGNALGGPGRIDEVAVWDRWLSPTDVSILYNNGAGYEIPLSTPVVPEAETTALLARMTTQPSSGLSTLINTTIKDLKDYGIWPKLDTIGFYTLHDEQASLLDWKGYKNHYNQNGMRFRPGMGFDNSANTASVYLGIPYIASTDGSALKMNDAMMGCWVEYDGDDTTARTLMGSRLSGQYSTMLVRSGAGLYGNLNRADGTTPLMRPFSYGLCCVDRDNSTHIRGVVNASIGSYITQDSSRLSARYNWVCVGQAFTAYGYTNDLFKNAFLGGHLTEEEHINFYNILNNFNTNVSTYI